MASGNEATMATITKKELVNRIAAKTGQTKSVTKDVIQMFLDEIVDELGHGNRLEFREFGVFEIKDRSSRTGVDPSTGTPIEIPARKGLAFRPSDGLKREVDEAADRGGETDH